MENLTNQILELGNGKKYFVLRQAAYKGETYYLCAEVTDNEEEFTNNFAFFQRVEVDGKARFACVDGPEFDGHLVNFDLALSRMKIYVPEEQQKLKEMKERLGIVE